MTKTYGNFTDFIDFSRASSGTALRKVSYGPELVDTANTASAWTPYAANIVEQDGDAVKITYVSDSRGAYIYMDEAGGLSSDMTVGKTYRLTFQAKINTGNATVTLYDGVTNLSKNISSTSYVSVAHNFVYPSGLRPFMYIKSNLGSGEIIWIKNVSLKEVTFDQADGTLELFNHPAGIPRIEYDANGNELGLLIEEQRTNLVTYSEDFTNASWSKVESSISSSVATAPDGVLSADKLIPNTNNVSNHLVRDYITLTATTHTWSVYAKADGYSWIHLYLADGASNAGAFFDLSTGVVGTVVVGTAKIESVGSGWYKCSVSTTSNAVAGAYNQFVYVAEGDNDASFAGDGTSGIYIWGAQLEQGSFPTSYIPTSGATATRSADIANIATANFGYNPKAGTIVVEFQAKDFTSEQQWVLGSNTASARWMYTNQGDPKLYAYDGVTTLAFGDLTEGQTQKAGIAIKGQEVSRSLNGGASVQNTGGGDIAGDTNVFYIGGQSSTATNINGHIKSLSYRPRRNSNTQLQEFTS